MSLRCAFREVHGACEPELIAVDRYEALRSAVLDAVGGSDSFYCTVPTPWGVCGARVQGVVELPEAGWAFACERHVYAAWEADEAKAIPLRTGVFSRE